MISEKRGFMGGCGSGRHRSDGKHLVEHYLQIDIRQWYREGRLASGQPFTLQLTRRGQIIDSIAGSEFRQPSLRNAASVINVRGVTEVPSVN